MSSRDNKKYYWLKLQDDFFKRHDIRIVESMPNGKDYIIFYLKLLCESTSHEGLLRFSEEIPYNPEMLATITNTNIDIVRSAIEVLSKLKMLEVMDDGTLYMQQVEKMIGSETFGAKRKREYRENTTPLLSSGTLSPSCPLDIDIELDKEIDIDSKTPKRFTKPTLEEVKAYCEERNNSVDYTKFFNYYESNGWKVGRNPMKDWKACVRTWERSSYQPSKQEIHNSYEQQKYIYDDTKNEEIDLTALEEFRK